MQPLGYIISEKPLKGIKSFVEVVNDIKLADSTKPILFVGLENARKHIDNFSILEKNPKKNVFWTFKRTERRVDFEHDIIKYYNYIINNILNKINYYYINIINLKYNKIKKLYNILFSGDKKYIYISKNMFYTLYEGNVLGISLDLLNFIHISTSKILKKLHSNKENIICYEYSNCVKDIITEIGDKKYIIPYFMSIQ